jgi:hypothetical protein
MIRLRVNSVFLLGLVLLIFASTAKAQPPFTGQTAGGPIISPYLGLTNGGFAGGGDVSNYFTLVLPQIRAQQEFQRQQGQISQLQNQQKLAPFAGNRAGSPIQSPQIRSTGHPTFFNNYSHYYTLQPGRRQ